MPLERSCSQWKLAKLLQVIQGRTPPRLTSQSSLLVPRPSSSMRKDSTLEKKTEIAGSNSNPGLGSGLLCNLRHLRSILLVNNVLPKELELWSFFMKVI